MARRCRPQRQRPMVCPIRPTCPPVVPRAPLPAQAPKAWVRRAAGILQLCLGPVLGSCPQYDNNQQATATASSATAATVLGQISPSVPSMLHRRRDHSYFHRMFDGTSEGSPEILGAAVSRKFCDGQCPLWCWRRALQSRSNCAGLSRPPDHRNCFSLNGCELRTHFFAPLPVDSLRAGLRAHDLGACNSEWASRQSEPTRPVRVSI